VQVCDRGVIRHRSYGENFHSSWLSCRHAHRRPAVCVVAGDAASNETDACGEHAPAAAPSDDGLSVWETQTEAEEAEVHAVGYFGRWLSYAEANRVCCVEDELEVVNDNLDILREAWRDPKDRTALGEIVCGAWESVGVLARGALRLAAQLNDLHAVTISGVVYSVSSCQPDYHAGNNWGLKVENGRKVDWRRAEFNGVVPEGSCAEIEQQMAALEPVVDELIRLTAHALRDRRMANCVIPRVSVAMQL
jgi:hypothetical protein